MSEHCQQPAIPPPGPVRPGEIMFADAFIESEQPTIVPGGAPLDPFLIQNHPFVVMLRNEETRKTTGFPITSFNNRPIEKNSRLHPHERPGFCAVRPCKPNPCNNIDLSLEGGAELTKQSYINTNDIVEISSDCLHRYKGKHPFYVLGPKSLLQLRALYAQNLYYRQKVFHVQPLVIYLPFTAYASDPFNYPNYPQQAIPPFNYPNYPPQAITPFNYLNYSQPAIAPFNYLNYPRQAIPWCY